MKKLFIDFETSSAVDLVAKSKNAASIKTYAKHKSTKILCTAYTFWEDGVKYDTKSWKNLHETIPLDLKEALENNAVRIYAHHINFELSIIEHQLFEKGLISINPALNRYIDTMWILAYHNCRLSLERGAVDANLKIEKDKSGKNLINLLCKPQKPPKAYYRGLELYKTNNVRKETKKELAWLEKYGHYIQDEYGIWDNNPKLFEELYHYNMVDTDVMYAIWEKFGDLPPDEEAVAIINTEVNQTGIPVDVEAAKACDELVTHYLTTVREEFKDAVCGDFEATQIKAFKKYLLEQGLNVPSLNSVAVQELLKNPDLDEHIFHIISLFKKQNLRSLDKYKKLLKLVDSDGRLRNEFVFRGAGQTGRDSSRGVQAQNAFRGKLNHPLEVREILKQDIPLEEKIQKLEALEGAEIQNILQKVFRILISAPNNQGWIVEADWSSVEARITFGIIGNEAVLDIFRRKDCLYCDLASTMFGMIVTKKDADKRQFGKRGILSCGYGVGGTSLAIIWKKDGFVLQNKDELDKFIGGANERKYLIEQLDGIYLKYQKQFPEDIKELSKQMYDNRNKRYRYENLIMWLDFDIKLYLAEKVDGKIIIHNVEDYIKPVNEYEILVIDDTGVMSCMKVGYGEFICLNMEEYIAILDGKIAPNIINAIKLTTAQEEELKTLKIKKKKIKQLHSCIEYIKNKSGVLKLLDEDVDIKNSEADLYLALISQKIVNTYRSKYPDVMQYSQNLIETFYFAYYKPDIWHDVPAPHIGAKKYVAYMYNSSTGVMQCRKPSGRLIFYKDVKFKNQTFENYILKNVLINLGHKFNVIGEKTELKIGLTFKGVKEEQGRGHNLQDIFITKNLLMGHVVQSTARDLFADACKLIRDAGYDIIIKKHDEIVIYIKGVPIYTTVAEIERLMLKKASWADFLIIDVEVDFGKSYNGKKLTHDEVKAFEELEGIFDVAI